MLFLWLDCVWREYCTCSIVLVFLFPVNLTHPHLCLFVALCASCNVCVPMCICGVCMCVCVVSAQLTIENDKLKEAQRLIRESEAKVGVPVACVALDIISHLIPEKSKCVLMSLICGALNLFLDCWTDLLSHIFSQHACPLYYIAHIT